MTKRARAFIALFLGITGISVFCLSMKPNISNSKTDTDGKPREISVSVTVPDTAWSISIDEIYLVNREVWVISRLERAPLMAAQIISTISDTIHVKAPMFPVIHYVIGKTWKWQSEGKTIFIKSTGELSDSLSKAEKIFDKKKSE